MRRVLLFLLMLPCFSLLAQQRSHLRAGQAPFFHGVASGDPLSDGVMLWTRVTPPTGDSSNITVHWQIATDMAFNNVVNFGRTEATQTSDFTVKLDVCGLQAATHYYYVFRALNTNSVIGRTKTAPSGGVLEARFAVASCSSYEHGYFNAYESMSKRNDLDAVIHLGDYIYEYTSGGFSSSVVTDMGRTYEPTNEVITLTDYRIRHSHYKLDDQLQRVHQIHPFITTWDDHETANDSYKDGAENHDPGTEGPWITRKVSSAQAYSEWMPIRNPDPTNDGKIWRSLRYGNLLDLIVLDSRIWARDVQDLGATNNTNRDLLGNDQFLWLENNLSDSTTQWKIICQQVMMAPLEIFGLAVNADQWDGYNKDRNRLINYIESNSIDNTVVLTGDIHTSWVNNVPGNNTNTAAVEFVVTSVTSPGLDVIETALGQLPQTLLDLFGGVVEGVIGSFNSHMEYINFDDHGYMVLTVNGNRAQGDYIYLEREFIDSVETLGPSYYTQDGVSNMLAASGPVLNISGPAFPPKVANQNLPFAIIPDTLNLSVIEATVFASCFVQAISACPNLTTSVVSAPNFGAAATNGFCFEYLGNTNYYGQDAFELIVCQSALPSDCDTIYVSVSVEPTPNVDTLSYNISAGDTTSDCFVFNDLYASADNYSFQYNGTYVFDLDSSFCFEYLTDSMFSGVEYASIIACDSLGVCDTVVLEFIVSGFNSVQIVTVEGESGTLLNYCLGFDELTGNIISSGLVFDPNNAGVLTYNDTCVSYLSDDEFEGIDTVIFYACDDAVPPSCDTIMYLFDIYINSDTVIDTLMSIGEAVNDQFAIIGVYPTQFQEELLFQYYMFEELGLTITLYDYLGKLIYQEQIRNAHNGLNYARLETSKLSIGNYMLVIGSNKFQYTKRVQKY